ncbi:hypothetical protein [Haloferula sp.]|uniref:hypothetical protein n=1 Tax=Haloferula sp. TaxID=2497595 RepID=UPI00329CF5C7
MSDLRTITPPHLADKPSVADFSAANHWTTDSGREYVVIDHLQRLDTFFLNIVGAGDQWLFCTSNGALSAGRKSPETALFPYYTVDKIIDNWNCTGPWTAIVSDGKLWNPFRPSIALLSPTRRRLMKSLLGDEVLFEEFHQELGLRFSYRWQFSERYGFVRRARLENESNETRSMRMADGLDNLLPPGVDSRMQLQFSCLTDAYKVSELECNGHLLVHRLAAGITDEPIPLESMRATTVWTSGLGEGPVYMARRETEEFLRGNTPPAPNSHRAKRGAMFLAREITLEPGESVEWMMVAEIDQTQAQVSELRRNLSNIPEMVSAVMEDVEQGRERLHQLVASADGLQQTADRDTALYHYQNTLSNILRGGVPENGYSFKREQFIDYLKVHNLPVFTTHESWLAELPETLVRADLLARIDSLHDTDLLRLAEEYLPLILSRRHGDPSRPWNRFDIRLKDEAGQPIHRFEGNWRDIFQNWEALAWSYPDFLGGFISKFLNASTVDGFNPYRITSEGVDWEVPEEDDPWATIGYWGDHQIVYLLKLLELEAKVRPDHLASRLDSQSYVFPDVPYRLGSWEQTLEDPRDTVAFDRERHDHLIALKERVGSDGLLLRDGNGEPVRVTLAEKLLLPAAVKLANLVPSGGIWMNTQRPEWNDANNALAGCGLSVVTACYLYRYLGFLEKIIGEHKGQELLISPALGGLVENLGDLLADKRWDQQEYLDAKDRFSMVKTAGLAAERHRKVIYESGPGLPVPMSCETIMTFLQRARHALNGVLHQNRRSDGLWHAYNVLNIGRSNQSMEIERLAVMLEGQVAILSSGILEPAEALELLESMPGSALRSERHQTYTLYPDAETVRFLDANQVAAEKIAAIDTLQGMSDRGDSRLVVPDSDCGFRFNSSLTNGYALKAILDDLEAEGILNGDRHNIEELYESVFNHRSFTGRSGTMFGYEGLGCVYWHMVSKLMLAAQEVTFQAMDEGADERVVEGLKAAYYSVQSGLGYRRSPEQYGAFPAEPYSHSPGHAGAQQPGLTGQVKEGILCRMGELGVDYSDGRLCFHPRLLRKAEFEGLQSGPEHPLLAEGFIKFTLARIPITYHLQDDLEQPNAVILFKDGTKQTAADGILSAEATAEITRQTGRIEKIEVSIPGDCLVS